MGRESPTNPNTSANIAKALGAAINAQGHAYQFAVIAELLRHRHEALSNWDFQVAEFPVQSRGRDTRIDLVLQHRSRPLSLVVECKRVNPRLSRWAFIPAPRLRADTKDERCIFERVTVTDFQRAFVEAVSPRNLFDHVAHFGYTLVNRSAVSAPEAPGGRSDIEDAATQVCLGTNGLINYYAEAMRLHTTGSQRFVVPVIVTTADLYWAKTNLLATDVASGTVKVDESDVFPVPMVWLQYPVSEGIANDHRTPSSSIELGHVLDQRYLRTIPIVSTSAPTLWESFNKISDVLFGKAETV